MAEQDDLMFSTDEGYMEGRRLTAAIRWRNGVLEVGVEVGVYKHSILEDGAGR